MLFSLLFSKKIIAAGVLFSLIAACSQALYVPSAETIPDVHVLAELTEGRKLYIKNCGSCHNLFPPGKYSDVHWTNEMTEMQKEAKITDEQAGLILKYLTGYTD